MFKHCFNNTAIHTNNLRTNTTPGGMGQKRVCRKQGGSPLTPNHQGTIQIRPKNMIEAQLVHVKLG